MLDGWLTVTMVPAGMLTVTGSEQTTVRTPSEPLPSVTSASTVHVPPPASSPQLALPTTGSSATVTMSVSPTGMAPPSVTLVDVAVTWDPKEPTNPGVPIAAAAFPGQPRTTINAPGTTRATTPSHQRPRSFIDEPSNHWPVLAATEHAGAADDVKTSSTLPPWIL
jgi:hypothetical protein